MQDGPDHGGEHDGAARGLEGLAKLGQLQVLQHVRDTQQIVAAPDGEPFLDRVDQDHSTDGAIHLGEGPARQGRQIRRGEHPQIGGRVDLLELFPICFVEQLECLVGLEPADVGDDLELPRLRLRCAGQDIEDGHDLADHVGPGNRGVLTSDGGLYRLHFAQIVGQDDGGLGPAPEQRVLVGVEVAGDLAHVQSGAEAPEVVFERGGGEMLEANRRQDRHRHRGDQEHRCAPGKEPGQGRQADRRSPRAFPGRVPITHRQQGREHRRRWRSSRRAPRPRPSPRTDRSRGSWSR